MYPQKAPTARRIADQLPKLAYRECVPQEFFIITFMVKGMPDPRVYASASDMYT